MFFQGFEVGSLLEGVSVASQQDGNETQVLVFSLLYREDEWPPCGWW